MTLTIWYKKDCIQLKSFFKYYFDKYLNGFEYMKSIIKSFIITSCFEDKLILFNS